MVAAQAPKRVAMQFVAESCATWDHRKLGGDLLGARRRCPGR